MPASRTLRAAVAGAALALLAVGCTSAPAPPTVTEGTSVVAPGPSCSPAVAVAPGLPSDFPLQVALPNGAVVTAVGDVAGARYVTGRVDDDVEALLAHFRTALPAAGAFVGRDEDEGRSGQLTFLSGSVEGAVTVARQRCPEASTGFTVSARRTR